MSTSRQPQGIPVGGQFAANAHSEAEVTLARPNFVEYEAPIVGTAKLNLGSFEVLPEWPAEMPEPSVTYDFDDGKVNTYVDIDEAGSIRSLRFWTDDIDGTNNSTDHGENPWEEFDEEDQENARAWGKAVHERIDASTYGVMIEATLQGKVREIILAHATGASPEPATPLDGEARLKRLEDRAGRRYAAAQRALNEHDRLSMSVLGARILQDFPSATEVRVRQDFDGRGHMHGHRLSAVRGVDGKTLTEGNADWNWRPTPDKKPWIGDVFRDIRPDFFEGKHPEMGFDFFEFDQETHEIVVPLSRDYAVGIEG